MEVQGWNAVEARKEVAIGLLKTDALIAQHRGTITPELLQWIDERATSDFQEELQEQGLSAKESTHTTHQRTQRGWYRGKQG